MSTIGELMTRFGELYGAGNYAEALTFITDEIPNHPADNAMLLCFLAAMSARIEDTTAALATFKQALEKGYWYHEGALRSDPDFASLQDIEEFKAIVEQNAQRRQVALATTKPILRVLEKPDTPASAPLLIALHGNLSNVDGYSVYWQSAVEQGWRVALPQSTRMSWFSGAYDWGDIEVSLGELDHHYQTLITNHNLNPSCIVIAGFSMGGLIAERAVITQRIPASGLLWIEGAPDEEFKQLLAQHQPINFRAYFAAGQSQDFLQTAETLSQTLRKVGIPYQVEILPSLHHEIPDSFTQTLDRALAFLCP